MKQPHLVPDIDFWALRPPGPRLLAWKKCWKKTSRTSRIIAFDFSKHWKPETARKIQFPIASTLNPQSTCISNLPWTFNQMFASYQNHCCSARVEMFFTLSTILDNIPGRVQVI